MGKYIGASGLSYLWEQIVSIFAKKSDVTIKSVKVNGTALTPDANKAVDVSVPTPYIMEFLESEGSIIIEERAFETLSNAISEGREVYLKKGSYLYALNVYTEEGLYFTHANGEELFIESIAIYPDDTADSFFKLLRSAQIEGSDTILGAGDKLVITDASRDNFISRSPITFDGSTTTTALTPKGTWETFLQNHQSIKSLNTNNTSAQTVNASEAIAGSGTINLHKVSKTGNYSDLIGKIPITITNGYNYRIGESGIVELKESPDDVLANEIWACCGEFNGEFYSEGEIHLSEYTYIGENMYSPVTESTVSGWGFTKNTGTYSKPSGGIPLTDLAAAVQTSLGKADTALQEAYYVVNVSVGQMSFDGVSKQVTADHTTAEIITAYNAGKLPIAVLDNGIILPFIEISSIEGETTGVTFGTAANNLTLTVSFTENEGVLFIGKYLATEDSIPTKTSDLTNDSGFITEAPVTSVNGQTGAVNLAIPSAVTESTVSGWGFTKNSGTYSKPSGGIPKTDLASAVQTSLGKADTALQLVDGKINFSSLSNGLYWGGVTLNCDSNGNLIAIWNDATSGTVKIVDITRASGNYTVAYTADIPSYETDPTVPSHVKSISTTDISNWNGKQAAISDLETIRSGAALGATALQSFTESDPTVKSWAKNDIVIGESVPIPSSGNYLLCFSKDIFKNTGEYGNTVVRLKNAEGGSVNWIYTSNVSDADWSHLAPDECLPTIGLLRVKLAEKYTKPSTGIPKTDLASAVQTSLGLADTALQSFTETDPTVPAWAKAASKPTYTAAEVHALPDTTVIPDAPGTLNTNNTTAQTASSSEALSGTIKLHKVAKTGTYSDLIGKPTIPTVPTNVSAFTNDAGYLTDASGITIYSGTATPSSSLGNDGDIYIKTS